jgi:prophage tail gpP-like protein
VNWKINSNVHFCHLLESSELTNLWVGKGNILQSFPRTELELKNAHLVQINAEKNKTKEERERRKRKEKGERERRKRKKKENQNQRKIGFSE